MQKLVKAIRRVYSGGEKGFTLIELLVVIGILAALAGVVTLGVTQFIGRGQNEANCTELHNVQTAATGCMVDHLSSECDSTGELITLNYLLTTPRCTYAIATTGQVTGQTCTKGTTMCAQ